MKSLKINDLGGGDAKSISFKKHRIRSTSPLYKFNSFTFLILLLMSLGFGNTATAQVSVNATLGTPTGSYGTLKETFDAINAGTHQGVIQVKINASITETASAVLNASGTGSASYGSVTVYPTVAGLSVTGNLAAPLIDLNGADNVILDGRVNATGTAKDLTISNSNVTTTAGTSTIRFINDASTNTVKYCTLNGSSLAALGTGGIVYLSTGTTTGNNSNTIDNCNITNAGGFRPLEAVCSNGTSVAMPNSNFTVSNSYIYNYFNAANNSYGIYTSNSNACNITNNSFYETTAFAATAAVTQNVIYINTGGGSHNISNNYIGGSTNHCGGAAMTKTDVISSEFYGIWVDGNATASNIQGNTIQNINWKSSGYFYGMNLNSGLWNIGTTSGNIIGAATGTNSIVLTSGSNYCRFYGIYFSNPTFGSLAQNNIVGSITTSNTSPANATNFFGIYNNSGDCKYSNNLIGSLATPNSISAISASTLTGQQICGLMGNSWGDFKSNTIANMYNACTNEYAKTNGIWGYVSAINNTIHDLYGSGGTSIDYNASVIGIRGGTSKANLIYNLYNSASNTNVIGIFSGGDVINNVIRIGTTESNVSFYGIWDPYNYSIYNNSVYIGGNVTSSNNVISSALVSTGTGVRNYRNNVFVNARSNTAGGTGKNYAAMVSDSTTLTLNYNDYYVSGTGGVFGSYDSVDVVDFAAWKTAAGKDVNSLNANPLFANPTAAVPNLNLTSGSPCEGAGVLNAFITTDFLGQLRSSFTPTDMGAYCGDFGLVPVVTSVSVPANGTYITGQSLQFTVNFDILVDVAGGTPTIPVTLNTGGVVAATYVSGSGTSSLVFRYTVASGKADPDGIAVGASIALNGATIRSFTNGNANLTLNSIGNTTSVLVDAVAPTASIIMNDYALSIGETSGVTITFSEIVSGFSNADLTIANGTLSTVSSSDGGITWTATFTPTANLEDATNVITLNNTAYTDFAGNSGLGTTNSLNYAIDTKRPTVIGITLSDYALSIGETSIVTITFSEVVSGFSNADLTIANGTLFTVSSSNGGITWIATFTPTANLEDATNVITLNNTAYTDFAGNAGIGTSTSLNYAIDTKRPTVLSVVRVNANPTFATSANFTVTFSEPVIGVDMSDFLLITTGTATGTISGMSGSGATYNVAVNSIIGIGDIRLDLNNSGTGIADIATNSIASGYSSGESYSIYQLPTVTTDAASVVGSATATLNGTVNANGNSTTVVFEYGTTTSYGSTVTADQSPVSGVSGTAVSYSLSGLLPFTTYHYRAVGSNAAGTTNGLDQTFTTAQATLTITAPTLTTSKIYDATTTASVTAGTLIGINPSDIGNVTVSVVASYDNANIGTNKTITIVYTLGGSASSKYIKPVDYVVTIGEITPKSIVITADAGQTKVYGASDPTFTYTFAPVLEGTDAITGAMGRQVGENANSYPFNLGTLTAGSNYSLTVATTPTFSITPKAIVITADAGQTKVYGAIDPIFTYTFAPVLEGADAFTGAMGREVGENVNSYLFNLGTLTAGSNYSLTVATTPTFSITPKAIVITADAGQTKVYGAIDPIFTYTFAPVLEGTDAFTGAMGREVGENVNSYLFNLGTLTAGSNYSLTVATTPTFSITPKAIVITANAGQTKVYGAVDPIFTYTFAPALEGSDSFTGVLARTDGETVGNYPMNQGTLTTSANYSLSFTANDFTITKAELTVTALDTVRCTGASNPVFRISYSGFVNDETPTVLGVQPNATCSANTTSAADIYPILVSGGVDDNYSFNYVNGNLTVETCTGISNNDMSAINIYPNPTIGTIYVENAENSTVELYNVLGEKLQAIHCSTMNTSLDLSKYAPGNYFIKVVKGVNVITKKVVKN